MNKPKIHAITAFFACLMALFALSCSDLGFKSSDTGSVTFSFGQDFLKNVAFRALEDEITEQENSEKEQGNSEKILFEVSLKGEYTASKSAEIGFEEWYKLLPNKEEYADSETEESKDTESKTLVTLKFDNIPVGKKIYAEVYVSNVYTSDGTTKKSPMYKGKSETRKIESGSNSLTVKISDIYKEFPFTVNLTFEKENIPEDMENFSQIHIFAFKKDSEIVKTTFNYFVNDNGEAGLNQLRAPYDSDGYAGQGNWVSPEYSYDTNKSELTDGGLKLTGTMRLMRDEPLIFIALVQYPAATYNSGYYVGICDFYEDSYGDEEKEYTVSELLSFFRNTAITPSSDGNELNLNLSKIVTSTSTALYSFDSSNEKWSFSLTDEYPGVYSSSITAATNSFAFDTNHYLYIHDYSAAGNSQITRYGAGTVSFTGDQQFSAITVDTVSDKLYGLSRNSLYEITLEPDDTDNSSVGTYTATLITNFSKLGDFLGDNFCFAVRKQKDLYIPYIREIQDVSNPETTTYALYLCEHRFIDDETGEMNETYNGTPVKLELSGITLTSSCKVTDITYDNDYLYILIRDFAPEGDGSSLSPRSRGAVVRCERHWDDKTAPETKVLGWTENSYSPENKYLYITYGNSGLPTEDLLYNYNTVDTPKGDDELVVKAESSNIGYNGGLEGLLDFYTPKTLDDSTLSSDGFYGPEKFLAIKPKKLVIADDGIALYSDNDILKYKNVNRIVTVDLEKFAIESLEETEATFEEDTTDMLPISGNLYLPRDEDKRAVIYNGKTKEEYFDLNKSSEYTSVPKATWAASSYNSLGSLYDSIVPCIPCGDSE